VRERYSSESYRVGPKHDGTRNKNFGGGTEKLTICPNINERRVRQ
jgi:hypothetical protein